MLDRPAAKVLWWAAKGDWDQAHKIVHGRRRARDAAWVHAYLHRVEGDLPNAGYWYRTAGKPVATGALEAEWDAIVRTCSRAERRVATRYARLCGR